MLTAAETKGFARNNGIHAVDGVYFDPRPAQQMLVSLPTDQWANGVPVFSFDAIAMLSQHVIAFVTTLFDGACPVGTRLG